MNRRQLFGAAAALLAAMGLSACKDDSPAPGRRPAGRRAGAERHLEDGHLLAEELSGPGHRAQRASPSGSTP